jgi:MFS family permease
MMYTVPLYFRVTQNSTNTAAGAHLFPAVLGNTVGGLLAGYTIQRTGRYKILIMLAAICSSITYSLLIIRWNGHISILESLEIIPGGFGTGVASSATFIALTSSLEHKDMAMATSGMYLASTVGGVVGIAVSSAVQLGTLRTLLTRGLEDVSGSKRIMENVISKVSSIAKLDEPVRRIVVESYVRSLEYSHSESFPSTS